MPLRAMRERRGWGSSSPSTPRISPALRLVAQPLALSLLEPRLLLLRTFSAAATKVRVSSFQTVR